MAEIDISKWKEFYIGGENGLFDIVKGKRLTKAKMIEGKTKLIGSSANNNGVTNKIGNTENVHVGNLITVSYNGSVGEAFYQEKPFIASDDVNVLYPRFALNRYIAWFICPIIRAVGKNYAFIDKWKKEDMASSVIKLPVDKYGEPDWKFMENYMKITEQKVNMTIDEYNIIFKMPQQKHCIDDWKNFKVGDIFDNIVKPNVYHVRDVMEDEDGIPYVVRSKYNNGMKYRVKMTEKIKSNPPGVISFGAENTTFFYQSEPWCSGRDIYYIDTRNLSKYTCFFLISCMKFVTSKYSYNYGLFPDLLKEEYIKLPVKNGNPDYEYMHEYMLKMENVILDKMKIVKSNDM